MTTTLDDPRTNAEIEESAKEKWDRISLIERELEAITKLTLLETHKERTNIIVESAKLFGVTYFQVRSRLRVEPVVKAKQAAHYVLRRVLNLKFEEIAKFMNCDHANVMWAVTACENRMEINEDYRESVNKLVEYARNEKKGECDELKK